MNDFKILLYCVNNFGYCKDLISIGCRKASNPYLLYLPILNIK